MFRLAALFGLLGLAAATGIIVWSGYASILEALRIAGWGILWTSLYHFVPLFACVIGWRALLPGKEKPSYGFFFYILWLRAAVNNLMPVARIGGEIVSTRVMIKHGMRKSAAIGSTIVELTLSITAVFLVILTGILLLSLRIDDQHLGWKLTVSLLAIMPMLMTVIVLQRYGFFGLCDKIFSLLLRDKWKKFAGNIGQLDRAIHTIYRRRKKVAYCFFWQIVSWSCAAGEVWLGLYFLGHSISLLDSFILEAMIQGTATAAFAIPGALGVQEAGFLFFGGLLGVPPDIAVALAVIRRCRDLILFLPGLVVWQAQEGKWLLAKK